MSDDWLQNLCFHRRGLGKPNTPARSAVEELGLGSIHTPEALSLSVKESKRTSQSEEISVAQYS